MPFQVAVCLLFYNLRLLSVLALCGITSVHIASMLPETVSIVTIETDSVELQGEEGRTKTVSSMYIDLLGEGEMTEEE